MLVSRAIIDSLSGLRIGFSSLRLASLLKTQIKIRRTTITNRCTTAAVPLARLRSLVTIESTKKEAPSKMSGQQVYIYHERQDALLCGQHALNNLIQECIFTADGLASLAHQLDELELKYMAQNNEGGVK